MTLIKFKPRQDNQIVVIFFTEMNSLRYFIHFLKSNTHTKNLIHLEGSVIQTSRSCPCKIYLNETIRTNDMYDKIVGERCVC